MRPSLNYQFQEQPAQVGIWLFVFFARDSTGNDLMVWDSFTNDLVVYKEDPMGLVEPIRTMLKRGNDSPNYMLSQPGSDIFLRLE
jgi:hypothetical protein